MKLSNWRCHMKKIFYVISLLVLLFFTFISGFLIGKNINDLDVAEINTFYATIEEINGKNLLVNGLDVNDINGRQRFSFTIDDITKLIWRGTDITLEDLSVGNTISVTYTGVVLTTSPVIINDVLKVQLLDD